MPTKPCLTANFCKRWGPDYGDQVDYLGVFIRNLEKDRIDPNHPEFVSTEPWVGYRFNGRRNHFEVPVQHSDVRIDLIIDLESRFDENYNATILTSAMPPHLGTRYDILVAKNHEDSRLANDCVLVSFFCAWA